LNPKDLVLILVFVASRISETDESVNENVIIRNNCINFYSRISAEKVRNICLKHEEGLKYLESFITGMVPSI
jgi:hypothetical protein